MDNPTEIAREALRQLALQRTPPTPDNYRVHYLKIAGTPPDSAPPDSLALLKDLVAALPTQQEGQRKIAEQCAAALQKKQWDVLGKLLVDALGERREEAPRWDKLIPALLNAWDARQPGTTPAKKRAALEHALAGAPGKHFQRLSNLLEQWSSLPADSAAAAIAAAGGAPVEGLPAITDGGAAGEGALALAAFVLENLLVPMLADDETLASDALALAGKTRSAKSAEALREVMTALKRLAFKVECQVDDRTELRNGLLHLLQLVIDNIGELVIDDAWLHGQMEVLRDIINRPLTVRTLDSAERRLKEVLYKQIQLKAGVIEAQASLKAMLTGFVAHLGNFTESTGAYRQKIDGYAKKIAAANNIQQLSGVIGEVMAETRAIQLTAERMHGDLLTARAKAESEERHVAALEAELARSSELIRHDELTGALNRRGMEELLDKEIGRAERRQTPLCLALIDIDNFKTINDSLGHNAGDAALVHLVQSVRETLRPQDSITRYGGEEFVVLLPEATLEEARQVIVRVQRELTRKIFLHENQKVLITFSAGVTQLPPGESRDDAIKRADGLMYQAKKTGKNKVVAA